MRRQLFFWILLFVLTLGLILVMPLLVNSREVLIAQRMMGGMMGNSSDMNTIHQLFAYRNLIHRTVEEIPNGIRAVTESDNPDVTALIQSHVPKMYQRVDTGQAFPMIRMVPTLPTMFDNADRYQRQYKLTSKGIIVTETSSDRNMVEVIQEHAREVTQFVEEGMSAMRGGMMR